MMEEQQIAYMIKMRESMEKHIADANEALKVVNWDRLDSIGMLTFAQAHAQVAQAMAQALTMTLLSDALFADYGKANIPDVLHQINASLQDRP